MPILIVVNVYIYMFGPVLFRNSTFRKLYNVDAKIKFPAMSIIN